MAILYKGTVELPSDIDGYNYIRFEESVDEVKAKLFREFEEAGLEPDTAVLS